LNASEVIFVTFNLMADCVQFLAENHLNEDQICGRSVLTNQSRAPELIFGFQVTHPCCHQPTMWMN